MEFLSYLPASAIKLTYLLELWKFVLDDMNRIKTKDWTESDLEKALKSMKKNKTRDPHDLINELFKEGIMGKDMKLALLSVFNQIKRDQKLPTALKFANITSLLFFKMYVCSAPLNPRQYQAVCSHHSLQSCC